VAIEAQGEDIVGRTDVSYDQAELLQISTWPGAGLAFTSVEAQSITLSQKATLKPTSPLTTSTSYIAQ
jgi:hypothetical protein